jgi:alkaline phosphatase D
MNYLKNTYILAFIFILSTQAYSQSSIGTPRLMHSPMLGAVSEDSALVWIRTTGSYKTYVEYDRDSDFSQPQTSDVITTQKENDYCAIHRLKNLQPDTQYFYRVYVHNRVSPYFNKRAPFSFRSASKPEKTKRFSIAFGSCSRYQEDPIQPIWNALHNWKADLFFWLGDNVYADTLDGDIIAEEYRRQREVLTLQPFLTSIPHLAVWDDHDYGLNNHDRTNPIKLDALEVFQMYWPNPSYGQPHAPGVYFDYSYGGVDFFFLDIRFYRDPNTEPDHPEKTMLGKEQLQWLQEKLQASKSPFKVLVSGSGWTKAKGMGGDSWASFIHERDKLFTFIKENNISGVVLLSGDTHVGELNCIPFSKNGGYDLYDLVSSPIAQSPATGWITRRPEVRIRPVYYSGPNLGYIEFVMDEKPHLRFELIDEYGLSVWDPFILYAHELRNGVESWKEKIDSTEYKRLKREQQGGGYYDK